MSLSRPRRDVLRLAGHEDRRRRGRSGWGGVYRSLSRGGKSMSCERCWRGRGFGRYDGRQLLLYRDRVLDQVVSLPLEICSFRLPLPRGSGGMVRWETVMMGVVVFGRSFDRWGSNIDRVRRYRHERCCLPASRRCGSGWRNAVARCGGCERCACVCLGRTKG